MAINRSVAKSDRGELLPQEELSALKRTFKGLMRDASQILGQIQLEATGAEVAELIRLLDHYLSYAERLCDERP